MTRRQLGTGKVYIPDSNRTLAFVMVSANYKIPTPRNEPIKGYLSGSPERQLLDSALKEQMSKQIEVPLIIGGKEVRTGDLGEMRMPTKHAHLLGTYHKAGKDQLLAAVDAALEAQKEWAEWDWHDRLAIFLKAAELLAGPHRYDVNASTMLCQGKNPLQAEIDSACELIDFFRFNTHYVRELMSEQPNSAPGIWNRLDYRPLEGFILAVTPFNFTSIAGNLPSAPAMVGNVALWKPASSAVYSGYYIMKLFMDAGVPPGVINFIPSPGSVVGRELLAHPDLAGIHFTGSTRVFQNMWATVGHNIKTYKSYPRIVGETGGKDFIFVHKSAKPLEVATAIVRGAFEYQGQKCSAASRSYIPESLWEPIKEHMLEQLGRVKQGDVTDYKTLVNAVIDKAAFDSITEYIDFAKNSDDYELLHGGTYDDTKGYFIDPTVFRAKIPGAKLMEEEIFGPVMTIYVYPDDEFIETMEICNSTSPYSLTGSIFAADRGAVVTASKILRFAAGNFYINDKPTGAVVGQQPFGGARASGTNDKAGSALNMVRWMSPRTIKETFVPPTDFMYPYMK